MRGNYCRYDNEQGRPQPHCTVIMSSHADSINQEPITAQGRLKLTCNLNLIPRRAGILSVASVSSLGSVRGREEGAGGRRLGYADVAAAVRSEREGRLLSSAAARGDEGHSPGVLSRERARLSGELLSSLLRAKDVSELSAAEARAELAALAEEIAAHDWLYYQARARHVFLTRY